MYMGKPYVYKIENQEGEFYYGVRWDYEGDPKNDLWVNYFTSSSLIKEIILTKGLNHFTPTIIQVLDTAEDALKCEYELIKNSINKKECLNRALGKCTIWDDFLKKKVSLSLKKIWEDEEYRKRAPIKSSGTNNHNYEKKPWRNVNSEIESWKKIIDIYNDFLIEKWDLNKYGMGRHFLMRRYKIAQGTARKFIFLIKNNWNPLLDSDYLLFLYENTRVS